MQMRRNRHPVTRIGAPRRLPHLPNPLTFRNRALWRATLCRGRPSVDLRQMPVQRKKPLPTPRPNVLHNNMLPKIRRVPILPNFRHPTIKPATHIILRHERRLLALKVRICGTIRKNHPRRQPCRRHVDRRNITPPMKPFPAIPGKTRLPVIRIDACPRKKFLGRFQQKMVRRRPGDGQDLVSSQRNELLIARYRRHNQ